MDPARMSVKQTREYSVDADADADADADPAGCGVDGLRRWSRHVVSTATRALLER